MTTTTTRPNGSRSIYIHKELFETLRLLLSIRNKSGTRGVRTPSEFFEREAIKYVRQHGRRYGLQLPPELEAEGE